jgi:hypothetical protein
MTATRISFRVDRGQVTAVLPDVPANRGFLTCYAHIGQHGECCREWYASTRPATKQERAPLAVELAHKYGPLRIIQRIEYNAWNQS